MEKKELITEEQLDTLRANSERLAADFMDIAKDGKSFVCPNPACDHGKGEAAKTDKDGHRVKNTGDGVKFNKDGVWHCLACDSAGDIITMYQLKKGVDDFPQAVADLEAKLGVLPPAPPKKPEKEKLSPEECIAQFEKLAFSPITSAYRSISAETLNKYGAKGCKAFKNPWIAGTYHGARAAVCFPTSGGSYFVRALSHKDNEYTDKWDIGHKMPFNLEALRTSDRPVFVVEGVIDALSIIEAGGAAVGLSGTDGIGELIEALKEQTSFSNCLLLAGDNDKSGDKANKAWAEKLKEIGVACVFVDTAKLYGGEKDANDALIADKAGFEARVMEAEAHKAQLENPRGRSMLAVEKALQNGDLKRYPTHVEVIDDLFNGGLSKKKLIVLGGQTGSSKTAFVQWWIESQAMKNPAFTALLFNFEMDTETLMARSISRLLYENGQSVTFNEVCDGHPQAQKGIELYKQKIGSRVEYYYGIRSKEAIVKIIRENVAYNAANGLDTPFIVCDYLQIMPSKESDERMAINASMEWLQDIAKDYNTVVIAITSMNRQTNNDTNDKSNPLNGASGSGRIEYDADFFLTIEGKEEKRVTMHKGRMVKPGTYKKLTFLGQYMTFVYKKDKHLEKTSYGEAVQSLLSGRELTRKETKVANDLTLKMPY